MVTGSEVTTRDREHLRDIPPDMYERTVAVRTGLLRRVSWGAIIAGTAVGMANQLVWTVLGAAIGLAAIEPSQGQDPGTGFAIGAGIWWLITGLVSLFLGGLVAGRLAGFPHPIEAFLHGVLVWSLSGILGLYLLTTTASSLIGGAFGPLAQGMAQGAAQQAAEDPSAIDRAIQSITQPGQSGSSRMQQPDPSIDPNNPTATTQGQGGQRREMTIEEEVQARQAADTAADVTAQASLWSFFALVLGAIAAGLGGYLGRPPVVVEVETRPTTT